MDRSNNAASPRMQSTPNYRPVDTGRASTESQRLRLSKKSSYHGIRNANRPTNNSSVASQPHRSHEDGNHNKARKGSLREAVRKIFGRRSKEIEQPVSQRSPPRHGYHRSEPPMLSPPPEEPEAQPEHHASSPEDLVPHRTLSAPLYTIPSPSLSRARSPYAVEFPQSARLKPLNLGNPFEAPGSQLRRRKTLPSILIPDGDASKIAASVASDNAAPPVPSLEISRYTPTPETARTSSQIRREKRRSRSADNLKAVLAASSERSPPRKRSDEIRYWRESSYGSVLRVSGFTTKEPRSSGVVEDADNVKTITTPSAQAAADPFTDTRASRSGTLRSSPPFRHGPSMSDADIRSTSGYGTELSRELEDRVAKLEAGLQQFQRSLQRMTAERNRKTVVMGGSAFRQRSSTDVRTPSMLADTLSSSFGLANYDNDNYDTMDTQQQQRPSTSPQPPRTPIRTPSAPALPPMPAPRQSYEVLRTPSPTIPAHQRPSLQPPTQRSANDTTTTANTSTTNTTSPDYTFRSLYEMLTDERSARRKLETEMRGLRREVVDLQYQVSVQSAGPSQRSSYIMGMGGMGGMNRGLHNDPTMGSSSRLRELLREHGESSRPGSAAFDEGEADGEGKAQQRDSNATAMSSSSTGGGLQLHHPAMERVVSRFSGSDSEVAVAGGAPAGDHGHEEVEEEGRAEDETESLMTSYDAYQTPREESRRFPFDGSGDNADGEMF